VDVNGIRVYLTCFPMQKFPGVVEAWQNPGTGISIRLAEHLLGHLDTLKEVECSGDAPPSTTFLPENESHTKLRERISSLLHRAAIDPARIKVTPDDVYLYLTGMASIYQMHNLLVEQRPGSVVLLGFVFHNTYHHIKEQYAGALKHFPDVTREGIDAFEDWVETESTAGRPVSYAFVEFPGNPLLASADVKRLKKLVSLSEAYLCRCCFCRCYHSMCVPLC
jgi:cystathionine gamma-synthase